MCFHATCTVTSLGSWKQLYAAVMPASAGGTGGDWTNLATRVEVGDCQAGLARFNGSSEILRLAETQIRL